MKCVKCGKEEGKFYISNKLPSPICKECVLKVEDYEDYYVKVNSNFVKEVKEESLDLGEEY